MGSTVVPPVTTKVIDYEEEVRRVYGAEYSKRLPAYQFSNGRVMTNADEDGCGVYGTAADQT